MLRCLWLLCSLPLAALCADTFTNPLLPHGADPWVTQRNGFYYYMNSTGTNLVIRRTRSMSHLRSAESKVVWTPPPGEPYSHDLWAPELHFLDGKWYIYFAADEKDNSTHRIWAIENASPDPMAGIWTLKGKVAGPDGHWAIDATVFTSGGRNYMVWSGWRTRHNGEQSLFIARLENPYTLARPVREISRPKLPWETVGDLANQPDGMRHVNVNEGPEALVHDGKVMITYSASGCWTDHYALGLLVADSRSNLLDPKSWHKLPQPVLTSSAAAHAYGTGHNSFFTSPDGTENWLIYHANPEPNQGCNGHRSPRAQRFTWNPDGTPNFGTPVAVGEPLPVPSGEQP